MNKFKFVIKGTMLWMTVFATLLFVSGADGIYNTGHLFQALTIIIVAIFCCCKLISKEEFEILSLYRWLNKIIERKS